MKSSGPRSSTLLVVSVLKGIALGVLCCAFFVARGNIETLFRTISIPLSGQPWSVEEVVAEMANVKPGEDILSLPANIEVVLTVVLTITACGTFGLWEGKRRIKRNNLEQSLRMKSLRLIAVNAKLKEMAVTDPLTRLANRRLLFKKLREEQKRARRYETELTCIMVDLDYFKNINDSHGHQFGDYVLEEVGRILTARCRQVDTVARYGGEEYAIVMPNTSTRDAEALAERIRRALASHKFEHGGLSCRLTATFGIAGLEPEKDSNAECLIAHADAALYEGKKSGRNAVVVWSESLCEVQKENCDVSGYMNKGRISAMREKLAELSTDLQHNYVTAVHSLLSAINIHDDYILKHSCEVSYYSAAIAQQMGLGDSMIATITNAAALHDIGKTGIDEKILTKPGKLSDEEFRAVKRHSTIAGQELGPLGFLSKEVPMIIHHHERYDGKGYPGGLAGKDIPLGARIIAVADSFSAMTTDRPYQKAVPIIKALHIMVGEAGAQFDAAVLQAFFEAVRTGKIALPAENNGASAILKAG